MDAHKNLVVTTVATAPSPATSGTSLVVASGDGAKFPAVPFNATISPDPTGLTPLQIANTSEIVRVTAISTDTLTITRAQESTTARTVVVGDVLALTVTAKTLTDIEAALGATNALLWYETQLVSQTVSASSSTSPNTIFAGTAITFDGATEVLFEFFCGEANPGASDQIFIGLYEDGTFLKAIGNSRGTGGSIGLGNTIKGERRHTPSAGSHTYSIRAWRGSANGNLFSEDQGFSAMFFRMTRTTTGVAAPSPGMVKLFDQTLAVDTASIDTGATIPATCDDLEIVLISRTDDAASSVNFDVTVNNDSGGNYDQEQLYAQGTTTPASGNAVAGTFWRLLTHGSGGTAAYAGVTRIFLPGYAGTTFNKTGTCHMASLDATAAANWSLHYALGWRSTAAINRVKVAAESTAKFKAGTRLIIYGRPTATSLLVVSADGWIDDSLVETWTYVSATTFSVNGDQTAKFSKGTRIKLVQSGAIKYFVCVGSSYSAGTTTVTITGGSDYTFANASIDARYHSYAANPQGYPGWFNYSASPSGWSSLTTNITKFAVVGRMVSLAFNLDGTSNAGATSMTAPIASANTLTSGFDASVRGRDNGTFAFILCDLPANSSSIGFYKDAAGNNFTASGSKSASGVLTYEV